MRPWLKVALSTNFLRKALGFSQVYSAIKFDLRLQTFDKTPWKNVLVLSPHPDDDAFGMGGFIKKMTTAGTRVVVAYFCDGSRGVSEGRPAGADLGLTGPRDESLIPIRKEEAQKAAQILGTNESIFWSYPDGQLASGTSAIRALTDLISRIKPEVIFLPSFFDNHSDHRVTNEIFINATKTLNGDLPIWAYEIWTPLYINRLVDISLYIKTKTEAILAHESQLKSRRYDKAIVGLNQYRGEINNQSSFAEGYLAVPLKTYRELYRRS